MMGMKIGIASVESSMELPKEIKNQNYHMTQQSLFWPYTVPKANETTPHPGRYLHSHVHCSTSHHRQDLETT
jgi:hypothetical protein